VTADPRAGPLAPRVVVVATHGLDEAPAALAWSPQGGSLAAASLDGEVVVLEPGRPTPAARMEVGTPVVAAGWSPGGTTLAVAGEDGSLWLWRPGHPPARHQAGATAGDLAWGPGGTVAVAAGDRVALWRPGDEAGAAGAPRLLPAGPGGAASLCWAGAAFGAPLLVGGVGGVREYRPPFTGGPARTWPAATVVTLAAHPSGVMAAGTLGGEVALISLAGRCGATVRAGRDAVAAVGWAPTAGVLAVVADGRLRTWTLRDDGLGMAGPRHLDGHADWVVDAAFSPAGTLLASTGLDGRLVLWDAAGTADPLERYEVGGELSTVGWRPDGRALAVGGPGGEVAVVDCSALVAG
jgi:WD40 repeat protein